MKQKSCSSHIAKNHTEAEEDRYQFSKLNEMERQGFADEIFEFKIARNLKLAALYRVVIEHYGEDYISRAGFYRLWDKFLEDPSTAGQDGRANNTGVLKELTPGEEKAWELIKSHNCKYKTGFDMARDFAAKVAGFMKFDLADIPSLKRCFYLWKTRADKKMRMALNGDRLKAFDEAEAYTHRMQLNPDDEHQIDEGQSLLHSWNKDTKVTLYFSRQIDVASGISRTSHFKTSPYTDRDTLWQMKLGCKSNPAIGLPHNCLPKCFRLDQAKWHLTRNIRRVNYLLRNRKGRRSRIQINPRRQPRANSSVERNIGETKRKIIPKIVRQFEDFLIMKNRKKPLMGDALAYVEGIGNDFTEFDHWRNNGKKSRNHKSRLDVYRDGAPLESFEFSDQEIDTTFLFYRRIKFTGHGVSLDGVTYDGSGIERRYRDRELWVGVPPEHSADSPSKVAYLAEEDKKTIFRPIATLQRTSDAAAKRLTVKKQEEWNRDYDQGEKEVEDQGALTTIVETAFPQIRGGVAAREASAAKVRAAKAKGRRTPAPKPAKKAPRKTKVLPKRPTIETCSSKRK
jgi:hypothetical protein